MNAHGKEVVGFSTEIVFCDARGASAEKGLIVANSGRSRATVGHEIRVNRL